MPNPPLDFIQQQPSYGLCLSHAFPVGLGRTSTTPCLTSHSFLHSLSRTLFNLPASLWHLPQHVSPNLLAHLTLNLHCHIHGFSKYVLGSLRTHRQLFPPTRFPALTIFLPSLSLTRSPSTLCMSLPLCHMNPTFQTHSPQSCVLTVSCYHKYYGSSCLQLVMKTHHRNETTEFGTISPWSPTRSTIRHKKHDSFTHMLITYTNRLVRLRMSLTVLLGRHIFSANRRTQLSKDTLANASVALPLVLHKWAFAEDDGKLPHQRWNMTILMSV